MRDDVLRGIDAPRPLPEHVRAALEEALLASDDELLGLLRTAQAPRDLPPALRDDLRRRLVRRRSLPVWAVAAAAAGVLVAAAVVALPPGTTPASTAQPAPPQPGAVVAPNEPSPAGAAAGTPPAVQVPAVAAEVPTPQPTPRPAAAATPSAASAEGGTTAGSAGGAPAAAGPQRGVTGVAPDEGPLAGGTRITLSGRDLSQAVRVELDGRPGSDLVVESDTRITVVTPAAPEPARATIEVHLSTGEVYLVPSAFSYLAAPTVTEVDPAEGPTTGGNVVVVTGSGFTERTSVTFGDTGAQDVQVVSSTELRAVAPAHLPGRVELTVTTAGGTSNRVGYVYRP